MVTDGAGLCGARKHARVYAFHYGHAGTAVDGEFRVVLTAEAMAALQLTEGAAVEVRPVEVRYLSVEGTLEVYRETLPQHREAYLELAK